MASLLDMVVEKLQFEKDMQTMQMDNQLNQAKMLQKAQDYKQSRAKQAEEMMASGQLRFQSTDPNDPANYPLIDVVGKLS